MANKTINRITGGILGIFAAAAAVSAENIYLHSYKYFCDTPEDYLRKLGTDPSRLSRRPAADTKACVLEPNDPVALLKAAQLYFDKKIKLFFPEAPSLLRDALLPLGMLEKTEDSTIFWHYYTHGGKAFPPNDKRDEGYIIPLDQEKFFEKTLFWTRDGKSYQFLTPEEKRDFEVFGTIHEWQHLENDEARISITREEIRTTEIDSDRAGIKHTFELTGRDLTLVVAQWRVLDKFKPLIAGYRSDYYDFNHDTAWAIYRPSDETADDDGELSSTTQIYITNAYFRFREKSGHDVTRESLSDITDILMHMRKSDYWHGVTKDDPLRTNLEDTLDLLIAGINHLQENGPVMAGPTPTNPSPS